jgi:hypothetical protein
MVIRHRWGSSCVKWNSGHQAGRNFARRLPPNRNVDLRGRSAPPAAASQLLREVLQLPGLSSRSRNPSLPTTKLRYD